MAEFKLTINDTKNGKSYQKAATGKEADAFKGKKLGDKVSGELIGLKGYEFEIRGGSDKQGFPMRRDVDSTQRRKPLIVEGVGVKRKRKGQKQRKSVRGNVLSTDIVQINLKTIKYGNDSLAKAFVKEEKTEEKPKEEKKLEEKPKEEPKKEEVKEEPKPEEKKEEPKQE